MTRGVSWTFVGGLILVALSGCKYWFEEREPWRREAELACLRSGAVKEGPAVALLSPISGPGICGADYPFKVAMLGETSIMSFADEGLRPPGMIPQAPLIYSHPVGNPANRPFAINPVGPGEAPMLPNTPATSGGPYVSSSPSPAVQRPQATDMPLSLSPPGVSPSQGAAPDIRRPPQPIFGTGAAASPDTPAGEKLPILPLRNGTHLQPAAVTPPATLACPMVSALDRWIAQSVQPAAQRWFGQSVVEIKQISSYACRGMNGQRGAKISEHAFGNALDIAAFTLANGYKVTVKEGWRGTPEEQGFLRDVQAAACAQFTTVLAPGSNLFHYDHIHVDLMRRASGRRICQPGAVSGEEVAARARAHYAARPSHGGLITGSIKPRRLSSPPAQLAAGAAEDAFHDLDLPTAVPGQD